MTLSIAQAPEPSRAERDAAGAGGGAGQAGVRFGEARNRFLMDRPWLAEGFRHQGRDGRLAGKPPGATRYRSARQFDGGETP